MSEIERYQHVGLFRGVESLHLEGSHLDDLQGHSLPRRLRVSHYDGTDVPPTIM